MITRDDIANFLKNQKNNSKESVLANFSSWAITDGIPLAKLAKLIADLRSYPEWTWDD